MPCVGLFSHSDWSTHFTTIIAIGCCSGTQEFPQSVKTLQYNMDKFLKRPASTADDHENKNPTKKPRKANERTANIKTVKKWMRELNVELEMKTKVDDRDLVTSVICRDCKEHGNKQSSSNVSPKIY